MDDQYEFSLENRNLGIEDKYNLHIGKPFRLQIETCVYDGLLTGCNIHVNDEGFLLIGATLKDGLFYHAGDPSEKSLFEEFKAGPGEVGRNRGFGRILDEEGFLRARDIGRR
jgi:hypothetical protein|tara:strand:- start:62 stop:397 length:336 start_codon:yes stop_codon:yes gene_type:complete